MRAAALALLLLPGCFAPEPSPQVARLIDREWRAGIHEEGSLDTMLATVRALGEPGGELALRIPEIPELSRLALSNPNALVRAEALRSAWRRAAPMPLEPYRVDAMDIGAFNERTRRLRQLMEVESPEAPSTETLELATWLGGYRFPVTHTREAVTLAEVVTSQLPAARGRLGDAFAIGAPGCVRHALVLVTLQSAADTSPVVRQEALTAARYLPPDVVLQLVAGMLQRESDSLVMLAALDSLDAVSGWLPQGEVEMLLSPLRDSTDAAVRRRVRDILDRPAG